jgi:hypothetical protein
MGASTFVGRILALHRKPEALKEPHCLTKNSMSLFVRASMTLVTQLMLSWVVVGVVPGLTLDPSLRRRRADLLLEVRRELSSSSRTLYRKLLEYGKADSEE